jgi:hypothetical protein
MAKSKKLPRYYSGANGTDTISKDVCPLSPDVAVEYNPPVKGECEATIKIKLGHGALDIGIELYPDEAMAFYTEVCKAIEKLKRGSKRAL